MRNRLSVPVVSGGLPAIGHSVELVRDPLGLFQRGHREHGSAFQIRLPGRTAVVLLGSEHNRRVFSETDRSLSIRAVYRFFLRMFSPDFYFFAPYEEYQRQREIVVPRFQSRQLDGYAAVMDDEVRSFMDGLGDAGEFEAPGAFAPLVMRIAARSFLGSGFADTAEDWFEDFRRFSGGADFITPGWLPLPHLLRSRAAGARIRTRLLELIAERRAADTAPEDFLAHMARAEYDDGEPVPDDVLVHLIMMLVWAGHETTTGQLAWGLLDLLRHPAELDRARIEAAAFPASPTAVDVRRLVHLDRCLHESERLHPVAFMLGRSTAEEIEVAGHRIPPGVPVMLSPMASHRLSDEFPDPDAYLPDRFASDPTQLQRLIGFGGGLHRCLGIRFAYLEMSIVLARLLGHYEFELLDPFPGPVQRTGSKWPQSTGIGYMRLDPPR